MPPAPAGPQRCAPVAAWVFDAEGVVVDTEPLWDAAQQEFLARRGIDYDRARVKHLLAGRAAPDAMRALQRLYELPGDVLDLAAERAFLVAANVSRVRFVEGFTDFFALVSARWPTALATAMDLALFRQVDGILGLSDLFGGHVATLASVGGRGKPAPDLFLHAAAGLGVSPASCVVVEDAPVGIEAAANAGMRSIAITTTFDASHLSGADLIVGSFAEIPLDLPGPGAPAPG